MSVAFVHLGLYKLRTSKSLTLEQIVHVIYHLRKYLLTLDCCNIQGLYNWFKPLLPSPATLVYIPTTYLIYLGTS